VWRPDTLGDTVSASVSPAVSGLGASVLSPATVTSGTEVQRGATLTFDCNGHSINQKDPWRFYALASGVEASSSMVAARLGDGN
jgi:hypothetical protein